MREELYELVWSEPMTKLAKRLGVSDRGLAKACTRSVIPVPPRGYWARLRHGKPVGRAPLPQAELGLRSTVEITPGPSRSLLSHLAPESIEQIAKQSSSEPKISVPKTLSNPHLLVRSLLERRRTERVGRVGTYGQSAQSGGATRTENRRLRILSALFKEFEKRGHKVTADPRHEHKFSALFGEAEIEFTLSQRHRIVGEYKHGINTRTHRPTGELVLRILWWLDSGVRTSWADRARKSLEEQLDEVIRGFLVASEILRKRRIERQEEEQRRRVAELQRLECERQEREEAQLLMGLFERIDRWRQAASIRAYVDNVREAAKSRETTDSSYLETWATWGFTPCRSIGSSGVWRPIRT
jgi:hypothetical protein